MQQSHLVLYHVDFLDETDKLRHYPCSIRRKRRRREVPLVGYFFETLSCSDSNGLIIQSNVGVHKVLKDLVYESPVVLGDIDLDPLCYHDRNSSP